MAMYKNLECRRNGTDLTFESRRNGSRRKGSRRNGSGQNGSRRNGNTPFLYVLRSAKTSFLQYILVTLASLKTFKARFIAKAINFLPIF